jgi:energy-coupling factor transporter ATP-binding protein EcfA2
VSSPVKLRLIENDAEGGISVRCIRIEFSGYKRLLSTGCNVDDRLVAFVGPNEAGKTSVLKALAWIDSPGDSALPGSLASRGQNFAERKGDDHVATATYRLESDDWGTLGHLDFETTAETYRYAYGRNRDGGRFHSLTPRLRREPSVFKSTARALDKAPKALAAMLAAGSDAFENDQSELDVRELHRVAVAATANPDRTATTSDLTDIRRFAAWLTAANPATGRVALAQAAEGLLKVADLLETEHPNADALAILEARRPRFREFAPDDRDLDSEFDTNQEVDALSEPLRRLLDLAGTSLAYLKGVWADESGRDTYLAECNERLQAVFEKAWSQSKLTVRLKAEYSLLKVQVKVIEKERRYYSTFGERSDGLKAFVALVGFLHALPDREPPILLIDEAETHLHLDAQADLIQVLQDEVAATQVFYTTHSPGCLPLDLGRGLRFVEPTHEHYASEITHNFWDSRHPGFSSVLFKMGAAAFAFSALRHAVLAEGPSDMILLPTLIRLATKSDTLRYQIAPRMVDLDETEVRRNEVAANVAYLTDGDQGGRDKRRHLRKKRRVPSRLLVAHPHGYAVEDYVETAQLLSTINELRTDSKRTEAIMPSALPPGETMGQRIDKWFDARNIEGPSKVAVATRLASHGADLRLRPGATTRLQKLHIEITEALDSRHSQQAT